MPCLSGDGDDSQATSAAVNGDQEAAIDAKLRQLDRQLKKDELRQTAARVKLELDTLYNTTEPSAYDQFSGESSVDDKRPTCRFRYKFSFRDTLVERSSPNRSLC